jgi:hypothetical protein
MCDTCSGIDHQIIMPPYHVLIVVKCVAPSVKLFKLVDCRVPGLAPKFLFIMYSYLLRESTILKVWIRPNIYIVRMRDGQIFVPSKIQYELKVVVAFWWNREITCVNGPRFLCL